MPSDKYRPKKITSAYRPNHRGKMLVQVKDHSDEIHVYRASKVNPQVQLGQYLKRNRVKIGYPIDEILSFDRKKKTFRVSWEDSFGFRDDDGATTWPHWNLAVSDLPYDKQMKEFIRKQTPSVQKIIKKLYKDFNGEYEARAAENDEFQVFADNNNPDSSSDSDDDSSSPPSSQATSAAGGTQPQPSQRSPQRPRQQTPHRTPYQTPQRNQHRSPQKTPQRQRR